MRTRSALAALAILFLTASTQADDKPDPGRLTVERIYTAHEFAGDHFSARWVEGIDGYLTWEPSKDPAGGKDLVRHDPVTGEAQIVVGSARLMPPGGGAPLGVDEYAFSKDRSKLLIFTNSRRVWRRNTRGDYWVLDRGSHELQKLGGDAPPASLMFAKFSPGRPAGRLCPRQQRFMWRTCATVGSRA